MRRSGSLGRRPSTVPGGRQPHARAFLRKATPAAEPPSPGAACAAAAGPTQRLSASLLSPLPGDAAAARRARSEGGGESGQEQRGPRRPRTTWAGLPPPAGRGPRGLAQRPHTRVGATRARSPSVAHRRSTRPCVCGVTAHRPGVCRRTGARTEAPDGSGQGVDGAGLGVADATALCARRDGREDGATGRGGPSRDTPRRPRARAPPAAEPPPPGAAARARALVRGPVSAPFLKEQLTFTDLTCFIQDCRAQMRPAEGGEPGPADPKPSSEDGVSCRSR